MDRKRNHIVLRIIALTMISILAVHQIFAATYAPGKNILNRKIRVVREYEIPVEKGKKAEAAIPALMSFRGATNEQIIQSSEFYYSIEPNKIDVTADNLGMPRRNYELTWNAPMTDKIIVRQTMIVSLRAKTKLFTEARLPYSDDIHRRFAASLGKDSDINPDNPKLEAICGPIARKAKYAEEAIEDVCDWINENVTFRAGLEYNSDELLEHKQGSCTPMSSLACAMLRRMGIPAESVVGKFIGSNKGHCFIEAYLPDAGWVFYDPTNHERGFKTPDCILTSGWAIRVRTGGGKSRWIDGYFSKEKDLGRYEEKYHLNSKPVRKTPANQTVLGATVVSEPPPKSIKIREQSIRQLIMDVNIPPSILPQTSSDPETADALSR
jgi:hypothetical protein